MNNKNIEHDIIKTYNRRFKTLDKRISSTFNETLNLDNMSLAEMKSATSAIIDIELKALKDDLDTLLVQKESIERAIEKKSEELQEKKYEIFSSLERNVSSELALSKLHQVKLQSIDLYDLLSELVESAIITALEKTRDGDIKESAHEMIKEITFQSIKEGSLNTIRIRKILSTILIAAIDVSEATPNRAKDILSATLKGMRSGLIRSIDRFKQRLAFMPLEAKHILIEDYDTIIEDLNQTDTLFSQVITTQAHESSPETRKLLLDLSADMRYDLEELVHISKETADVMKARFSNFAKLAVRKADSALKSQRAQEAKRMGIEAWGIAKVALGSAIKTAKEAIDKKE